MGLIFSYRKLESDRLYFSEILGGQVHLLCYVKHGQMGEGLVVEIYLLTCSRSFCQGDLRWYLTHVKDLQELVGEFCRRRLLSHVIVPLVRAMPTGAKTRPKHLALPPMPIALDFISGMRRQESPN